MEVKWMRPFYLNELGLCIHEFDSRTGHHYYPIFIKGDKIIARWRECDGPDGCYEATYSIPLNDLPKRVIVYHYGKFVFSKQRFLEMLREWSEKRDFKALFKYFR